MVLRTNFLHSLIHFLFDYCAPPLPQLLRVRCITIHHVMHAANCRISAVLTKGLYFFNQRLLTGGLSTAFNSHWIASNLSYEIPSTGTGLDC